MNYKKETNKFKLLIYVAKKQQQQQKLLTNFNFKKINLKTTKLNIFFY